MGIKGLTKLLNEEAPGCMKETTLESFFGRRVAFDASMHIYQFMAVVGRAGDNLLTNEAGEVTSHLQGLYFRTLRILDAGIKPIFVFDGKPPDLKSAEIAERRVKREQAEKDMAAAREAGNDEDVEKFAKRTLKVTPEHNEECKRLLRLMGVPVLEAPSEAEAQCARLCKAGKVYAVGTEDMDTLTFGTTKLARHLMEPENRKQPVIEFDLERVLKGLEMTMDQFVDLCILLGCDYCDSIKGIGPKGALKLIREFGSLEDMMPHLKEKFTVPENFPYQEARKFFLNPDVTPAEEIVEIKLGTLDEEGLLRFMVDEKSFDAERIKKGIEKLKKAAKKGTQHRMESFFKPSGTSGFAPLKRKDIGKKEGKGGAKKAKGLGAKAKTKGVGRK